MKIEKKRWYISSGTLIKPACACSRFNQREFSPSLSLSLIYFSTRVATPSFPVPTSYNLPLVLIIQGGPFGNVTMLRRCILVYVQVFLIMCRCFCYKYTGVTVVCVQVFIMCVCMCLKESVSHIWLTCIAKGIHTRLSKSPNLRGSFRRSGVEQPKGGADR